MSYHADFTHAVEIMRKNKLNKLKNNVRNFFKEFSIYVLHEVSDQKTQQFVDAHNLDIDSLMSMYTERYKQSAK